MIWPTSGFSLFFFGIQPGIWEFNDLTLNFLTMNVGHIGPSRGAPQTIDGFIADFVDIGFVWKMNTYNLAPPQLAIVLCVS